MRFLLTGATGGIGSVLYEELKKHGEVVGTTRKPKDGFIQCELSRKEQVKGLFENYGPFTHIFHFAANPIVDVKKTGLERLWEDNVMSTLNLLQYLSENECPVFIFASSTTVYAPESLLRGATEDMVINPANAYGASKAASEALIGAFGHMDRIKPVILRFCAIVGKNFTHGVLPDLCRKYKNDPIVNVLGEKPGSQKPFLFIDDCAKATISLAFSEDFGIHNVCNESTVSVQEIIGIISSKLNIKKEEVWMGNWLGDNLKVNVSNKKYTSKYGNFQYNSREAIIKVVGEIINDTN